LRLSIYKKTAATWESAQLSW